MRHGSTIEHPHETTLRNTEATSTVHALVEAAEQENRCAFSRNERTRRTLQRYCQKGALASPFPGLYVHPSHWNKLEPQEQMMNVLRALARLHPEWIFSHSSAALIHGLFVGKNHCATVHVASTFHSAAPHIVHHAYRSNACSVIDGLRVTPLLRTIFDCTRSANFADGLAVADSGLAALHMTCPELYSRMREAFRGHRGIRRSLATIAHADARSENGGESFARSRIIELGFLLPELQVEIVNPIKPQSPYRVDFYWELANGKKVAGELDGMIKYVNPRYMGGRTLERVLIDERERESCLNAADVMVMRFKYKDVVDTRHFTQLLERFGVPRVNAPFRFPD